MEIKEKSLSFLFSSASHAIKFDDTAFYRKRFNNLPSAKGVDIIATSAQWVQLIEIKDCRGHESENRWKTAINNSSIGLAPNNIDGDHKNSFDIEVAKKVSSTLACLYGAWTKKEQMDITSELLPCWTNLNDDSIPLFNKCKFRPHSHTCTDF